MHHQHLWLAALALVSCSAHETPSSLAFVEEGLFSQGDIGKLPPLPGGGDPTSLKFVSHLRIKGYGTNAHAATATTSYTLAGSCQVAAGDGLAIIVELQNASSTPVWYRAFHRRCGEGYVPAGAALLTPAAAGAGLALDDSAAAAAPTAPQVPAASGNVILSGHGSQSGDSAAPMIREVYWTVDGQAAAASGQEQYAMMAGEAFRNALGMTGEPDLSSVAAGAYASQYGDSGVDGGAGAAGDGSGSSLALDGSSDFGEGFGSLGGPDTFVLSNPTLVVYASTKLAQIKGTIETDGLKFGFTGTSGSGNGNAVESFSFQAQITTDPDSCSMPDATASASVFEGDGGLDAGSAGGSDAFQGDATSGSLTLDTRTAGGVNGTCFAYTIPFSQITPTGNSSLNSANWYNSHIVINLTTVPASAGGARLALDAGVDPCAAAAVSRLVDSEGLPPASVCGSSRHEFNLVSPLVLHFAPEKPFRTTNVLASRARFDLEGRGYAVRTGWLGPDSGLLALDKNGNGRIDDGTEALGEGTVLKDGRRARDGYEALAQYDESGKGYLDQSDPVFGKLVVWLNAKGDGKSRSGELKTLASLGITRIDLKPALATPMPRVFLDNDVRLTAKFYGPAQCGTAGCNSYDVYFRTLEDRQVAGGP